MRFFYSLLLILSIAIGFSGVAEAISLFPPRPTFPLIPRGSSGGRPTLAPGRVLVQMKPGYSPDRLLNETALARLDRIPQLGVEVLEVPEGQEETLAAALSRRPDVLYAEIDRMSHVSLVPNDPYYSGYLWHLPKIQAPKAWDYTTGDSSVIIAVLDTGVDTNHPELKAKLLTGYNAFTKTSDSMDDQGHGTYVSGLATATSNNGVGVTGVSWGARVLPVKVMDSSGSGPNSTIAAGITWAADNGAKIINLSLGGEGYSQTMHNAVKYASRKGILLLAAMGNAYKEGNPVEYPAAYPEVMAVGAVNYMDARAGYSNTGSHISVAAPGGEILSNTDTDPRNALWSTYLTSKGGYGGADGTSGATPVVAGLAALLWSKAPTYTATEMRQLIERTAVDLGPAGKDNEYGYGRIDAGAAMVWIGGTLPDSIPPRASLTAPTAGALVSGTVTITGTVTDDKALKSFQVQFGSGSSPTAWTNIGAAQTQPVTLGTLASWNTTGLLDGSYTIRVTAVDVAGNSAISLPTTVTVNNSQATLTVKTSVTAAKTGEYVGLSVQSSQPLLSTPRLTVSGGCVAAATIPLYARGGGWVGAYIPASGTSVCSGSVTATGADALNGGGRAGAATRHVGRAP
ncbi:MAG: S8 family serine peptidase, partial [Armatimonadetes bacterium]|nr:S8 family serine peptidase [Armatimonadota bacterium]